MGTLFLGHLNIVTGSHGNRDELKNKLHKYGLFPHFWDRKPSRFLGHRRPNCDRCRDERSSVCITKQSWIWQTMTTPNAEDLPRVSCAWATVYVWLSKPVIRWSIVLQTEPRNQTLTGHFAAHRTPHIDNLDTWKSYETMRQTSTSCITAWKRVSVNWNLQTKLCGLSKKWRICTKLMLI